MTVNEIVEGMIVVAARELLHAENVRRNRLYTSHVMLAALRAAAWTQEVLPALPFVRRECVPGVAIVREDRYRW